MNRYQFGYLPSGYSIRFLPEWQHDPYHARRKWREPTQCPDCKAVFHDGRWRWDGESEGAEEHLCPACQRIHDLYPAGYLIIGGGFFSEHREEIENLLRNHVRHVNDEHPLQRMMAMEKQGDGSLEITLTDPHLARGLGDALHKAYGGQLSYQYQNGEYLLRVHWERD